MGTSDRGPGLERQLADEIEDFIAKELKLPKRAYKRLGDNVCVQLGKPGNVHIAVVAHLDARLDQGAPLAVTQDGLSGAGASGCVGTTYNDVTLARTGPQERITTSKFRCSGSQASICTSKITASNV